MPRKSTPNRKDGRYSGYVFLGYTAEGKEKRQYVYANTKKELDEKLLDLKIKIATGKYVFDKMTLSDWASRWINGKQGKSVRTITMYKSAIDRYIIPELGSLELSEIKPFHVQLLINNNSAHPRTCQIILVTLSQLFDKACASELMINNPAAKNKIDMPSKQTPRKRALTDLEILSIKNANLTDIERIFITLCLECGLRKSEALAVMQSDIKNNKLTVTRSVQDDGSIKQHGKSNRSFRTIPLSAAALDVLQLVDKKRLYLVTNTSGKPLNRNQYARMWSRIKYKLNKSAGGVQHLSKTRQYTLDVYAIGKDLSAHILRHTFSTNLAKNGYSPAEIQYLMGHATAMLALEVYTHIQSNTITADRINGVKTVSK